MNYSFRKADLKDLPGVWKIIQDAILRRKADGSKQWQDGYPNIEILEKDINDGVGYVLEAEGEIAGYCAVLINDEPAYNDIQGEWLMNGDFVVFHRVAVAEKFIGKGLGKKMLSFIEDFARSNNIPSVKADTNFDNAAMLKTFESMGYRYCGEVFFRGGSRKAFEKIL